MSVLAVLMNFEYLVLRAMQITQYQTPLQHLENVFEILGSTKSKHLHLYASNVPMNEIFVVPLITTMIEIAALLATTCKSRQLHPDSVETIVQYNNMVKTVQKLVKIAT